MDTPPTLLLSCEVEKNRSFSTPIWLDLHKMFLIFLIIHACVGKDFYAIGFEQVV